MLPETLTLNFLCSPRFRPSSIYSSWAEVTSWLSVCGSGSSWQPVESMSALPGRAMKFWLFPCVPQNTCVGSLSHICSFICFSQSFWMECFPEFWTGSSSGWRHTSSSGLSVRTVVPALGCLWGRGGGTVSTVWLWGWLIAILPMLLVSQSSLGKFCAQLAVGQLWGQFLGVTHPCWELQGVFGKRVYARSVGLSNFWCQIAQTLPTKDCFHCVRDPRSLFDDQIHRNQTQRCWALWLDAVETILAKGDWVRWSFPAWAGGCCEQHHRGLAAHCLLPQRDWQERQRR